MTSGILAEEYMWRKRGPESARIDLTRGSFDEAGNDLDTLAGIWSLPYRHPVIG